MQRYPGLAVELVIVSTTGDRVQDRPLTEIGGKGLFVKELELALLEGRVDFAVHSYKDVPVTMPLVDESNLVIAAVPEREDPRDVAIMFEPTKGALPERARIGTSSLRRKCQILATSPGVTILPLRGNIDTRIKKLRAGEYDVIILAMAGLKRAGLFDPSFMSPMNLVPAAGQGALAVQCRKDDRATFELLHVLNDPTTAACVNAERRVVELLEGDCHSPIAAWARIENGALALDAVVGGRDGVPPVITASATVLLTESKAEPLNNEVLSNSAFFPAWPPSVAMEQIVQRSESAVSAVLAKLVAAGARTLLSGEGTGKPLP